MFILCAVSKFTILVAGFIFKDEGDLFTCCKCRRFVKKSLEMYLCNVAAGGSSEWIQHQRSRKPGSGLYFGFGRGGKVKEVNKLSDIFKFKPVLCFM